jgi:LysM repeat protein
MSEEIPVLEIEKEPRAISMKGALAVVVSLHVVAVFGIVYFSGSKNSNAEDKKFLLEDKTQYVGVEPTPIPSPTPPPVGTPIDQKPVDGWNNKNVKLELKTYPNTKKAIPVQQNNSHYTKEYVVKHGDTFYSIVRKYKLDGNKLKEINKIKNENTLTAGQKLKLM